MTERFGRDALLTVAAITITGALVYAAATISPILAVAAALALVVFISLGTDRTGLLCLMGAFATAPMGRGIEGLSGGIGTPTDLLLGAGVLLVLPGVVHRKLGLPPVWVASLVAIATFSLVGSLITETAFLSIFSLVRWMVFLGVLPMVIAWWRPTRPVIVTLFWSYVAGHMASTAYGMGEGAAPVTLRYDGLTIHPNGFGLAGLITIAILFYLWEHHREPVLRMVILGAGLAAAVSIWFSGSRAALAVAVVLCIMLPLVERSALSSFAVAGLGVLGLAALPLAARISGKGSALSRLLGEDDTAEVADDVRSDALQFGIDKFLDSPIFGSGLVEVEVIHNIYVEVAVAAGIVGLIAYLVILFTLARGLFGDHPERRVAWVIWAAIGIAAALPGLWDASIWVPGSLAILPALRATGDEPVPGATAVGAGTPAARRSRMADI